MVAKKLFENDKKAASVMFCSICYLVRSKRPLREKIFRVLNINLDDILLPEVVIKTSD